MKAGMIAEGCGIVFVRLGVLAYGNSPRPETL